MQASSKPRVTVSIGPKGPDLGRAWMVRFQGAITPTKQEAECSDKVRAAMMALDYAAWFERDGYKVELLIPKEFDQ